MRLLAASCMMLGGLLLAGRVVAQAPAFLVKDINMHPHQMPVDSDPEGYVTVGTTTFFTAFQPETGRGLWKTDGTPDGTVLVKAVDSPLLLTNVAGELFFTANDGSEIWKSDGTTAGTVLLRDVRPGPDGPITFAPNQALTAANGLLFFVADDGVRGIELWKSDGSRAGTVLVKDINPGPFGSLPPVFARLTAANGLVFFIADDGSDGPQLWRSDGTAGGTFMVTDPTRVSPTDPASQIDPQSLTDVDGVLFFLSGNGYAALSLWRSDGTATGTRIIRQITIEPGARAGQFTSVNGTLSFVVTVYGGDGVTTLWRSDGTDSGTVQLSDDLGSTFDYLPVTFLTDLNGTLLFAGLVPEGRALWRSDGTRDGTVPVAAISSVDSIVSGMASVNGRLYFTVHNSQVSDTLWTSDGTETGTVKLADLRFPGPLDGSAVEFGAANGTVVLTADDGQHGTEVWQSDGTPAGTVLLRNIAPEPDPIGTDGSAPSSLVRVDDAVFFAATDATHGRELWKSDGTDAGTTLVRDIAPGAADSNPQILSDVNGALFFSADDGVSGIELWTSDGTAAGTRLVRDINPGSGGSSPRNFNSLDGTAFFRADDGGGGFQLWKSDGTESGTTLVKRIDSTPDPVLGEGEVVTVNGTLFLSVPRGTFLSDLWKSDGTEAGTVRVVSKPLPNGVITGLTNVGGTLFFVAGPVLGLPRVGYYYFPSQLWKSDGTDDGTQLVVSWRQADFPLVTPLVDVNGTLFFGLSVNLAGAGLWMSDGTTAGTVQVIADPLPSVLVNVDGTLFFGAQARLGEPPMQLWKSDGTAAGTTLVDEVATRLTFPTAVGDRVLYSCAADTCGVRVSDGTPRGTRALASGIHVAPPFVATGSFVFFGASDPSAGWELWAIPKTGLELCAGDCNGDAVVTIDELVTAIDIALGESAVARCTRGDADGDGEVTIRDLVAAVGRTINGCH